MKYSNPMTLLGRLVWDAWLMESISRRRRGVIGEWLADLTSEERESLRSLTSDDASKAVHPEVYLRGNQKT